MLFYSFSKFCYYKDLGYSEVEIVCLGDASQ